MYSLLQQTKWFISRTFLYSVVNVTGNILSLPVYIILLNPKELFKFLFLKKRKRKLFTVIKWEETDKRQQKVRPFNFPVADLIRKV